MAAGIVGAGVWAGLRKRKGGEAGGYFLASNSLGWTSIGLALFATNISCLHLVNAIGLIRTGDTTQYANLILERACFFFRLRICG